ncbi:MAG: RNA polymerase sigma factor [Dokdonella sp.]|nr:RNA polymerase sigma factor [Dokdonella sp.]
MTAALQPDGFCRAGSWSNGEIPTNSASGIGIPSAHERYPRSRIHRHLIVVAAPGRRLGAGSPGGPLPAHAAALAHGRLPARARDLNDTHDLVQITLLSALKNLEQFESRHEGALLAYLRTTLLNAIRGEIRRVGRAGVVESLPKDSGMVGAETPLPRPDSDQWLDYENALAKLPEIKREAVLLRLEFGMSYAEIASALDRPSEAAASMMVSRALVDLARHLE